MPQGPETSVVIPARNAANTLAEQLMALSKQKGAGLFEVVVADNGSVDATVDVARSFSGQLNLRLVDASRHQGVNAARNAGVRGSSGDRVLLCDADDRVDQRWVAALSEALSNADAAGGAIEWMTDPGFQGRGGPTQGLPTSLRFLPYAVGCNCGFWRSAYEAIGGFDERYRGGGDEIDFFFRLQLSGFSLKYASDALVYRRPAENEWASLQRAYWRARAQPQLYACFRNHGAERSSTGEAARAWLGLLRRAPTALVDRERRMWWLHHAARRWGRLVGSVKHRCVYL